MAFFRCARAFIYLAMLLATLLGAGFSAAPAVAQERRFERGSGERVGDDRGDSDSGRERRSWRRGRFGQNDDDNNGQSRREGTSSRESTERRSADAPAMNMTDYAKGLVKQHDKNGNMMLDGDERSQLRGRAAAADANNDNVITVDELVAGLSGASSASSSSGGSSNASSASSASSRDEDDEERQEDRGRARGGFFGSRRGDRDRDSDRNGGGSNSNSGTGKRVYTGSVAVGKSAGEEQNQRRTYRFTPAAERLPTGLPSWFKSRDKNGDGQVFMSEYSRSWSSRMVSEFRRYDTNDDGVVTAKEAAANE
jgi:hypothetical protein